MTRGLKLADSGLTGFAGIFGKSVSIKKYLISFHENPLSLGGNVSAVPWWEMDRLN